MNRNASSDDQAFLAAAQKARRFYARPLFAVALGFLQCMAQRGASAQTTAHTVLIDAPAPQAVYDWQGAVTDASHAPLEAASVVVLGANQKEACRTESSAEGNFSCDSLAPGHYRIVVSKAGFAAASVETEIPRDTRLTIELAIATENASVNVSASAKEVAEAQVQAAEKQRILGIVPNFYTSFDPGAAPLTTRLKFSLAMRDAIDPVTFLGAGVAAGLEQANNSYKDYGQGAAGYGKRYGAAYGDGFTSDVFRHAVYPALFHEDPRYFYQGRGSLRSRFFHAIRYAFVLQGDDGKPTPNYSFLAGYLTSGAISNAYYPHGDRGAGLVFTRAGVGVAGTAAEGVLREFVFNHFTAHKNRQ